jgi:hypothetical protein
MVRDEMQQRYLYTVPAEETPCVIYADIWDAAYRVVRELHDCRALSMRVIGASKNDWLCPLSCTMPEYGEVADEIKSFGFVRWDPNSEEAWMPREKENYMPSDTGVTETTLS